MGPQWPDWRHRACFNRVWPHFSTKKPGRGKV